MGIITKVTKDDHVITTIIVTISFVLLATGDKGIYFYLGSI